MKIWLVSREYAGIAEAGGVKNVACSLAENLAKLGHSVTLFIPLYACSDLSNVKDYKCFWHSPVEVFVEQKQIVVSFGHGSLNNVQIVFIGNTAFSEKHAVYTYTMEEELKNPLHKKGEGHKDVKFLNTLFQKAVASYGKTCDIQENPDVIHCQDAPTAMLPAFINQIKKTDKFCSEFYKNTKCIVTIHNAGAAYHHEFANIDEASYFTSLPEKILSYGNNNGRIEPFLVASQFAQLTTVSPQYAKEILLDYVETDGLGEQFRNKKISILGITNGIDFDKYDPQDTKKSCLPFSFNPEKCDLDGKYKCREFFFKNYAFQNANKINELKEIERFSYLLNIDDKTVIIAYHGRVVQQKGIDVMFQCAMNILSNVENVKFVFAGQGSPELEQSLINIANMFPGKCVYFRGYNKMLSRLCVASADFSLHTSYFEPCGLEDFTSQTYGTIPVAHATGGLCKIVNGRTGFLYKPNDAANLIKILKSLITLTQSTEKEFLKPIIQYASYYIHKNFPWDKVVQNEYLKLYKK